MREASAKEYADVVGRRGREKRVICSKRSISVEWRERGTVVAEKTDILKRGKVVSSLYLVAEDPCTP